MDYPKPHRLVKNFYSINYQINSRAAFMNVIAQNCQDKEDVTACQEKYAKAFDFVFDQLKTKLEEEDRAAFIFESRWDNPVADDAMSPDFVNPTGYEKWS
jgi:hypothetical protein